MGVRLKLPGRFLGEQSCWEIWEMANGISVDCGGQNNVGKRVFRPVMVMGRVTDAAYTPTSWMNQWIVYQPMQARDR